MGEELPFSPFLKNKKVQGLGDQERAAVTRGPSLSISKSSEGACTNISVWERRDHQAGITRLGSCRAQNCSGRKQPSLSF